MGEVIRENNNERLELGTADLERAAKMLGIDAEMPRDGSFALENLVKTCDDCVNSTGELKAKALESLARMINEADPKKVEKFAWKVAGEKAH